jgi:hypothetical protein
MTMAWDKDLRIPPRFEVPPYAVDASLTLSGNAGVTIRVLRTEPWGAEGVTWLSLGYQHGSLAHPLTEDDRRRLVALLGGVTD